MKDSLGNTVNKGDLLYWMTRSLTARVIDVRDGGISIVTGGNRELTPGKLLLEVEISVQPTPKDPGMNLSEFLCVRNPKDDEAIDRLLSEENLSCKQTKQ